MALVGWPLSTLAPEGRFVRYSAGECCGTRLTFRAPEHENRFVLPKGLRLQVGLEEPEEGEFVLPSDTKTPSEGKLGATNQSR